MPTSDRAGALPRTPGRRERKKLEIRERIVACAAALFASRGYDATTMEEIGECADVARATVFNYFARKEEIVLAWFERRRADLTQGLAEGEEQTIDASSRLRQAVRLLARIYEEDPATGRAMVRAWLRAGGPLLTERSGTPALFAETIRLGQQRGDIAPEVDADRAALVLLDAFLGVLYRWVRDEDGQFAFGENLMATLDLVLAGIARAPSGERAR